MEMESPIKMDDLGVPLFSETSISPKKGISPTILLWGMGCFDHQSYEKSGRGSGFLGNREGVWILREKEKSSSNYHFFKE